jgi:polyhydroxybutyrate depolymerase
MIKKFAATLALVGALQGIACSPDSPDPGFNEDAGVLVDAAGTRDASATGAISLDTGVASSDSAAEEGRDSGAKQDAAVLDAALALDARAPRVEAGQPPSGAVDASDTPDASADGGASTNAKPSAGCGKSGRPSAGRVSVAGDHNLVFPASYDGKQPFPLLLGFHAASNPIEQIENLTKGSDFETSHVRAFPKSKGSAWDYATDIGKVLAMYDALVANHCIDLNRVFATGHSSGAQLIVQILTPAHKADADHLRFTAVAPVAASRYGTVSRAIPVMYIQGASDNVRSSNGSDVVKEFTTANGCMPASTPYVSVPSCMSSGKSVMSGCVRYDGCSVPTVWCSHDDPQYSNTNHGWPCFASKAMYDFFGALP